ncbi:hypothetical protein DFH06DRAFT_1194623 [Mycena polygramma]|nr:hypothetical protein DFH06DRAFT_1194623 [Mycena polygramma]
MVRICISLSCLGILVAANTPFDSGLGHWTVVDTHLSFLLLGDMAPQDTHLAGTRTAMVDCRILAGWFVFWSPPILLSVQDLRPVYDARHPAPKHPIQSWISFLYHARDPQIPYGSGRQRPSLNIHPVSGTQPHRKPTAVVYTVEKPVVLGAS